MIENRNENEKKSKKKIILILLLLILLLLLGLFFLNRFFGVGDSLKDGIYNRIRGLNGAEVSEVEKRDKQRDKGVSEEISEAEKTKQEDAEKKGEDGDVTKDISGERELEMDVTIEKRDEQRDIDDDGFSVHQISFGNSVVVENDDIVGTDLKIESVSVEIVESLDGEGVNAIVTWTTTKNSISELSYSKKDGSDSDTIREKSYGVSHAMFIEDLEEGEKYILNIKVRSKNNQTAESGYVSFDSELEGESFLESMGDKIKDLFGF